MPVHGYIIETFLDGDQMERAKVHVEEFLAGTTCNANATPIVEEVVFNHAFKHSLVYAGRAIKQLLEEQGHAVTLQYCDSPAHGHPVPYLIARDASGAFVAPAHIDIRDSIGSVDVLVVDGITPLRKVENRKRALTVYDGSKKTPRSKPAKEPTSPKTTEATAKSQRPTAIVVLPASMAFR